jgi:glucokinase
MSRTSTTGTSTTGTSTVGVDIGGTSTRIGIVDHRGAIVDVVTSPTPRGADAIADHLVTTIGAVVRRSTDPVTSVGVGIPGRVDGRTSVVSMAVNVGIVEPHPLGRRLEQALGLPVALGNDVDLAALGADRSIEATAAADGDAATRSLTYLSIGTGFAIGLVLGGVLHTGQRGAGEIGHVPMPGVTDVCPCGQIGCVETVASGAAMMRAWGRPDADVTALWDAATAGDERALAVRARAIDAIVWTLQCVAMVFDPDTIVIGGGVSQLGGRLLDTLTEAIDRRAAASQLIRSYAIGPRLLVAPPDAQYGVLGAALRARETRAVHAPIEATP